LLERHSQGLIALSGLPLRRVAKALEENRADDARTDLGPARADLRPRLDLVEMQNAGLEIQARSTRPGELAGEAGLPLVATGDVHYLRHEDAQHNEALLCIQSGDSLKNPNHWKFDTDQFFFKTAEGWRSTSRATRRRCGARWRFASAARRLELRYSKASFLRDRRARDRPRVSSSDEQRSAISSVRRIASSWPGESRAPSPPPS